ncbi:MAG: nitroreductase family protein [Burkholderiales bacterium]
MMTTALKERTDVLRTIYERRAVRAYTAERPSDDAIRELIDAAVQAPTAMHIEPWAFVVVQDRALLRRYSDRAKRMLLDDLNAGGELAHDAATRQRLIVMLSDASFNIFYDAGTLIAICRKPLGRYAEADCWLAAENLMLAAYDKHLGTCCIGFAVPILNAPDVKQELRIPADVDVIVPIIVGSPRGPIASVKRKPAEILHWVR